MAAHSVLPDTAERIGATAIMMRSDYDTMLGLADKLHYKSLTQLQETAFRTRSLYGKIAML